MTALKRLLTFLILVVVLCALTTSFAPLAKAGTPTQYELLAPFTGTGVGDTGPVTAADYIPGIFKIFIGAASGLAVLAIAYGGVRYMMSDVVTNKSNEISRIKNALLGLLLVISSFLLLRTIDPQLTGGSALTRLTNLDDSPILPTSPTGGQPLGYRLTWYATEYPLMYYNKEYELTYTVPLAGGGTRDYKERWSTQNLCTNRANELQNNSERVGSFTCNKVRIFTNDPLTDSTAKLDPNTTYTAEPAQESGPFQYRPQCTAAKNALPALSEPLVNFDCTGVGRASATPNSSDFASATPESLSVCKAASAVFKTMGRLIPGGQDCVLFYEN